MPFGTLDRTPPPFFKQGPSALSKLMVCSALALFLMVADARFQIAQPLRAVVATVLYPVQWLAMRPVLAVRYGAEYFESLSSAQAAEDERAAQAGAAVRSAPTRSSSCAGERAAAQAAGPAQRISTPAVAAEVLYDAADPYTRKVIIDKGVAHGMEAGSPVIDESGVLGQVTRVYPLISEVTLVTDRDQAIPVLNARTGARSVAYGEPSARSGSLELRFMAANADVQPRRPAHHQRRGRRLSAGPAGRQGRRRSNAGRIPPSPASPARPGAGGRRAARDGAGSPSRPSCRSARAAEDAPRR